MKAIAAVTHETGAAIWPSTEVLIRHLEKSKSKRLQRAKVLELGAGMGLLGLAVAALGAEQVFLCERAVDPPPRGILDAEIATAENAPNALLDALRANVIRHQDFHKSSVSVDELEFGCMAQADAIIRNHGAFERLIWLWAQTSHISLRQCPCLL
jgi:predicted nicotinamide N-methyase